MTASPQGADPRRIVTFYSYKGGTGRTMALANVAWILAANGYRVLAIDWDLESPGLHRYFHPFLRDKDLRTTDGVIDLIRRYSDAVMGPGDAPDLADLADIHDYAVSLDWDFGAGGLDFVGAGRQDPAAYSTIVSTFDWEKFWTVHNGGAFLEELRKNLQSSYDFVLIDSRTGLSDTAGICTVQLPDVVVECFTLNTQSVEGAAAVARSIVRTRREQDRPPIRIYPVPTRVEDGEQRKLDRGRTYARRSFASFLDYLDGEDVEVYWGSVELPYRPFYAYEEMLATFGDRPRQENSLLAPYVRLASRVSQARCQPPVVPEIVRQRVLQQFERPEPVEPKAVLINYVPLDRIYAEWIHQQIAAAGHRAVMHFAGAPLPDIDQFDRVIALVSKDYETFPETAELGRLCSLKETSNSGEFLLPVLIDGTPPPPWLSRRSAVDLVGIGGDRAQEILFKALGVPNDPLRTGHTQETGVRYPGLPTPHWNVKLVRNTHFSGRHRLLESLRDRLVSGGSAGGRVVLEGINGVGKTQIAIEYAYRFAAAYDIVWWISAEQPARVRTNLAELGTRLGLGGGASAEEQVAAVKEHLRRGDPSPRWLVVLDNADAPEELQEFIPGGPGHVIITARNPNWQQRYHLPKLDVSVFARGESIELLTRRVPGLSRSDADRLADNLGDLPLALEQAAAWLALTGMPVQTYLDHLAEHATAVLDQQAPPDQLSTAATVRLSFERLRRQNPPAARLLELFAFLAPEAIPYRIIASDQLSKLLAEYDPAMHDPLLHAALISEIGRYALARIDSATGGVVVHRLTQRIIRDGLSAQEQRSNREQLWKILATAKRGQPEDRNNWAIYEELRSHLEASGGLESKAVEVRQLFVQMVQYLRYRGDYQGSQELAERVLARWSELLSPDDDLTLLLQFELANTARARGHVDRSHQIDREVYERMGAVLGDRHPYSLMTAGGLAADLRQLGAYAEARRLDEQTVARFREVLGVNNARTLMAVNNLAVSLRLTGNVGDATSFDQDNLERGRRNLGDDDQRTLLYTSNYGRDLREIGELRKSRLTLEDLFERQRKDAKDHPDTWRLAKNLAVTLRRLGETPKAHSLVQEAFSQLSALLGPLHPDTVASELELACALWELGQPGAARKLAEKVHAYYHKRSGARHPFTLITATDLSLIQRADGDLTGSQATADDAATQLKSVLGPRHPYSLVAQMGVANCLYALGSIVDANRHDEEVLSKLVDVLGERHPTTLAAEVNLAMSAASLGDGKKEHGAVQRAIQRCDEYLGNWHPYAITARKHSRVDVDLELQPT